MGRSSKGSTSIPKINEEQDHIRLVPLRTNKVYDFNSIEQPKRGKFMRVRWRKMVTQNTKETAHEGLSFISCFVYSMVTAPLRFISKFTVVYNYLTPKAKAKLYLSSSITNALAFGWITLQGVKLDKPGWIGIQLAVVLTTTGLYIMKRKNCKISSIFNFGKAKVNSVKELARGKLQMLTSKDEILWDNLEESREPELVPVKKQHGDVIIQPVMSKDEDLVIEPVEETTVYSYNRETDFLQEEEDEGQEVDIEVTAQQNSKIDFDELESHVVRQEDDFLEEEYIEPEDPPLVKHEVGIEVQKQQSEVMRSLVKESKPQNSDQIISDKIKDLGNMNSLMGLASEEKQEKNLELESKLQDIFKTMEGL